MRLSGSFVCAEMHRIDLCRLRAIPAHAESQSADDAPRPLLEQQRGEAECLRGVEIAQRYNLDRRTMRESSGWQR